FFFNLPEYKKDLLVWKNSSESEVHANLGEIRTILNALSPENFSGQAVGEALAPLMEREGKGSVLWPLRVALSGQQASPDPLQIAEVLGKEETLDRIGRALEKLNS